MYTLNKLVEARYIPYSLFSEMDKVCNAIEDGITTIEMEAPRAALMQSLKVTRPYAVNSARLLAEQFCESEYIRFQANPEIYNHSLITLSEFNMMISTIIDLETVLFNTRKAIGNQITGQ